jgi:ACR3 family arsenite transporter
MEIAQVNLPVGSADLGDDRADAAEGGLRCAGPGQASTGAASAMTLFVNWAVKPFSMALLAWIFVRQALR